MPRKKKKSNNYLWIFFVVFVVLLFAAVFYSSNNFNGQDNREEIVIEEPTDDEKESGNSKELIYDKDEDENAAKKEEKTASGEDEDKEIAEEDNKEDEEITKKGNIYTASFANESLSFEYPLDWKVHQLEEKNKFSFAPQGKVIAEEYQGDIIIAYKENKQKIPVERYYDGLNDINLFEDAAGGYEREKSGEYDFYRFKEVIGYTSSTVGVFVLSDFFVEMTDVYNKHQENGVFDQLMQSFRAE